MENIVIMNDDDQERWNVMGSCPTNCGIGMANYTFCPTNIT